MKIGLTFDELLMKNIGKEIYLEYIEKKQIKNIELCIHEKILVKDIQKEISLFSNKLKAKNSFHIPHHINEFAYDLSNFKSEKKLITDNYLLFINNLEEHLQYNPDILQKIIIHGGSINENKEDAIENAKHFIDWFINMTLSRNLDIRLLFETLLFSDNTLGNDANDLKSLVSFFNSKHLNICGDIGHIMRDVNFSDYELLKSLNHFHIHGYNKTSDINHIPISKSDIIPDEIISILNEEAILIHEVLYFFANYNYIDDLGID